MATDVATLRLEPSRYVSNCIAKIRLSAGAAVLDLACGSGRHAALVASTGCHVTAADIDPKRLTDVGQIPASFRGDGTINTVRADGSGTLPFRDEGFDLVMIVHFVPPGIIANVTPLLRRGGHLLLETYGGHGENWRMLPEAGKLRRELKTEFDVLDYRERLVGPTKHEAASVRFLARRR